MTPRPLFAILWFASWGLFQAYAVASFVAGRWERPEAFPEGLYNALVYPDLIFIPLYLAAAVLLGLRRQAGMIVALFAGGAVTYVMIYLLALSSFKGLGNLVGDATFLALNAAAVGQVAQRLMARPCE